MNDLSAYGTHFIVGLSGLSLNNTDKEILKVLQPSGVILFAHNFAQDAPYKEWIKGLSSLQSEIKKIIGREKYFISIDHEGGRVHRIPAPITHFPPAMQYARQSAQVARAMAIELKSIGCNLVFAPVVDVHSNPENPVIGERAFGSNPDDVMAASVPFAQTLLANGILCCAKHFPGHGDTSKDSHLELPCVDKDKAALMSCELKPFQAFSKIKVPFVMTAHVLFPKLDSELPATLSRNILKGILRRELHFKGVIISDDLCMKAVCESFKQEDCIGDALKAGCDLFCVSRYGQPDSTLPLQLAENLLSIERKDRTFRTIRARASKLIERLIRKELYMYEPTILSSEVLNAHTSMAFES